MFSVRTETLARWAREGRIQFHRTLGGHRRYTRAEVARVQAERNEPDGDPQRVEDAVRLYAQGWSIRQVAQRFDVSYGLMRDLLKQNTTLKPRGGRPSPALPPQNGRTDP